MMSTRTLLASTALALGSLLIAAPAHAVRTADPEPSTSPSNQQSLNQQALDPVLGLLRPVAGILPV
ncbi:hypothetical protein [Streptomyces sp. YIM B13518]|uniref:hypothetical protein n=1 Tax=Streptomyces sp. YIM B13518 TaxID=3366316 RepID=UPI003697A46F